MIKRTVLIVALLTMGNLLIVFQPNENAETTELNWLPLGTDLSPSINGYITGFLMVNVSDLITINWKSGDLYNGGGMWIIISTGGFAINHSDNLNVTVDVGSTSYHNYIPQNSAPPQTMWLRMGFYDLIFIEIVQNNQPYHVVFNFTIDREIPDIHAMNDNITNLTTNLNTLNESMNTSINTLNASINASIKSLNDELSLLSIKEANDTNGIIANINNLRNYTNQANAMMMKLINETVSNSTNIFNWVNQTLINFADFTITTWNRTNNLSIQLDDERSDINLLRNENQQLQSKIDDLKNITDTNSSKLNNQIEDTKKQANTNIIYAGILYVFGIVMSVAITVTAITIYDREIQKRYGVGNHNLNPIATALYVKKMKKKRPRDD